MIAGFFASSGRIAGTDGTQALLSIWNPKDSGIVVLLSRSFASGVSKTAPLVAYEFGRVREEPVAGLEVASVSAESEVRAARGVVRLGATLELAAGRIWSGSPGEVGLVALPVLELDGRLSLVPGEGAAWVVSPDSSEWSHWSTLWWDEA